MKSIISMLFFLMILAMTSSHFIKAAEIIAPGSVIRPEDASKPAYNPGFGWGGMQLNDNALYEIAPEKCKEQNTAEVVAKYGLTSKIYLLKSSKGYLVAELKQTLRQVETGQRRKKNCRARLGLIIQGDIDCKGVRVIKESPYKGCAFETKVWGHSLSEAEAFNLVYNKLTGQFSEYKKNCVARPKQKSLEERMIKF